MTDKKSSYTVAHSSVNSQKHINTSTLTTAGIEVDKSKPKANSNRRQWGHRNKAVQITAGDRQNRNFKYAETK